MSLKSLKEKGKLKTLFNNLIDITDISLYNKSKGLLDTKTLAGFILLAYGIKNKNDSCSLEQLLFGGDIIYLQKKRKWINA